MLSEAQAWKAIAEAFERAAPPWECCVQIDGKPLYVVLGDPHPEDCRCRTEIVCSRVGLCHAVQILFKNGHISRGIECAMRGRIQDECDRRQDAGEVHSRDDDGDPDWTYIAPPEDRETRAELARQWAEESA